MRTFITLLLVGVLGLLLCGPAAAAAPAGAVNVRGAERAARAAHRALVLATVRDREARHVLKATRYYSAHDYSDFAGRYVNPVPVGRWVRLARLVGWPWSQIDRLEHTIARESSGGPGAFNDVIGCTGLLQIWPGNVDQPGRLTDPRYNLKSGLKLWREAGWGPWAL